MSYNFPDLKVADICSSLLQLCDIDLPESWFKMPDSTQWQGLCRRFVSEITGSPEDVLLMQPLFSQEFEYPEIHTDAVPVNHLMAAMSLIMPYLYVPDFSGDDIFRPMSQRVKKNCCAVINFLSFKHSRIPVYEDIKAEIDTDRDHHDALIRRVEELKQKINQIRSDRAQQEPDIQKLQDKDDLLSTRIQELQKKMQTIQHSMQGIENTKTNKKAKVDQLKNEIQKNKEAEDKLSVKIVQSPEKVNAEKELLTQRLNDLRCEVERKRHRLSEMVSMRKCGRQAKVDADKGLLILDAIKTSNDKEHVLQGEIAQLHDKIQYNLKEREKSLKTHMEQLQQKMSAKQEKLSKMSMQHHSRMRVLQEQHQAMSQDKEENLKKQNINWERKAEYLEYKKKLEQEVVLKQKNVDKDIDKFKEMYGRLLQKVDEYNNDFGFQWEETRRILKE